MSATAAPRHVWMDAFRGLAVILVVLLHAQTALVDSGIQRSALVSGVNDAVGAFRIPGLLLLSGLLLPRSLRRPAGEYLSGKARRILWPWLLWTAAMLPLFGWAAALDPTWWLAGTHTWYLTVIFACYLLGLATRRVPPALTAVLLFTVGTALAPGALATDGTDLYSWLRVADRVAWFGGFFFAGAALAGIVERLVRIPWWVMVVPVALTGMRGAEAVEAGKYAGDHSLGNAAWSVLGVLAVLWVLSRLPVRGPQEWLAWVGRHSIVVFVAHYPVIRVLRHLIVPPPGLPGVGIYLAAGLGVSLLLAALFPRVRWLFEFPGRRRVVGRAAGGPSVAVLA